MALAMSLGVVTTLTGAPEKAGVQQPFRARVDVVAVNVAVTRGRSPVVDLESADFELRDNGVRQSIDAVSLETVPIDVTIVMGGAVVSRSGIEEEVARGSLEGSRLRGLLEPSDRLRWLDVRMEGVREVEVPRQPVTRGVGLARGLPTIDSIVYALSWPVDPDRRHLVIAFTDGFDRWSIITPDRLPALIDRSDAVLHAVLYKRPPSRPSAGGLRMQFGAGGEVRVLDAHLPPNVLRDWRRSFEPLADAVRRSGGLLHAIERGVDPFEQVLDDFRSSYVLRYTPTGVEPGGWHEIDVEVTRSGRYSIRARRGYQG